MNHKITVLTRRVESKIVVLRGRKVILDSDLAQLYGVAVKRLNEQVKRNANRFPADFLFRLSPIERQAAEDAINPMHSASMVRLWPLRC